MVQQLEHDSTNARTFSAVARPGTSVGGTAYGKYLLVVLFCCCCCCCCCCCSCTSRCVFLLVAQLGLAVCKIVPTHWRWPFQDLKATFLLRKQLQNVARSQWLVHLCVINLICICTDALLCQHAWAEHGPYLSLPPSHTDKTSLKNHVCFWDHMAVCATPQARRVWTTSIFFDFQAFSGRNRNRQSMLHHSASR